MKTRHPVSNKPILNQPDGQGLYTCQYTGLKVKPEDAIFLGPCTPQVHGTYVCHPSATSAFRSSKRLFDESEANCNTCKHLVRPKQEKRKDGQMAGRCHIKNDFLFHPDDYMGMPCYESRYAVTAELKEKNT